MRISIAFGFALGVLAFLTQDAAAQFMEKKVLTLAAARKMVAAAEAEAERHHLAGVVAVVDDGGWPILIERMDQCCLYRQRRTCARQSQDGSVIQETKPGARGSHQPWPYCGCYGARLCRDARRASDRGRW